VLVRRPVELEQQYQIIADINDFSWTDSLLPDRIDYLIHCAAVTSHDYCEEHPDEAININIKGTVNLLQESIGRINKFIFLSTGDVYGYNDKPITEGNNLNPIDTYSRTKLVAEKLIALYDKYYSVFVLRLFHVYGSGMSYIRLIPRFIRMIEGDKKAYCRPDGKPFLTLTYINELLNYTEQLLNLHGSHTINISGSECLSVGDIYNTLARQMGKDLKCELRDSNNISSLVADRGKLIKLTGIESKQDFKSICKELIDYELVR